MIKVTFNFHEVAKDGLPKKSGDYVVLCGEYNNLMHMSFSEKHKKFNVYDYFSDEKVNILAIEVNYWAEMPEELKQ